MEPPRLCRPGAAPCHRRRAPLTRRPQAASCPSDAPCDGALPPSPASPCAPTHRLLAPPPPVKQANPPQSPVARVSAPHPHGVRHDRLQVLDEAPIGMGQGRTGHPKRAHGATEFAAGRCHRHAIKCRC
ncbi:hypothetical protein BS78_05G108700 [Paspalum vaginatum]|nr:hypothetical protein BS78_05G108700 [Paspalum vaginatum]